MKPLETDVVEKSKSFVDMTARNFYPDDYKNTVFYIWYITGKPRKGKLRQIIPANTDGAIPEDHTLSLWEQDFHRRAIEIDKLVDQELEKATVLEKVAMLEKHAENAREMQEIAIDYLRTNQTKLNPHSAVRLWVDGVRVERESVGLSELLENISKAKDEDIMEMIEKLMNNVDVLPEELEQGDMNKDE